MSQLLLTGLLLMMSGSAFAEPLERACVARLSVKKSRTQKEKICACVIRNLKGRVDQGQWGLVEKMYASQRERWIAAKDPQMTGLIELDAEIQRQCLKNPLWKFTKEDMGEADPL